MLEPLDILTRLGVAAVAGALPGMQREKVGVPAGLRTHLLVSLGSAIFVLAALDDGADNEATSRIIQGIATGVGFVGAGGILKASGHEVQGLTTAANIWLTAALGTAAGTGHFWLPVFGAIIAWVVLSVMHVRDPHARQADPPKPDAQQGSGE